MPTRIVTAAAVAMAFVCPAHAESRMFVTVDDSDLDDPALVIPTPSRGELARVELSVDSARGTATLTLALRSKETIAHAIATTLDVPPGTKVTGMAITSEGQRMLAKTLTAPEAREEFRTIVHGKRDPALLELAASTRRRDRLSLEVFPLSKTSPAKVEIMLELPAATTIAIETPVRLDVEVDGKTAPDHAIVLPARVARAETSSQLSLFTSLFAGPAVPVPTFQVGVATSCSFGHDVSSRVIRNQVKLAHPRLTQCWLREAQRNRKLQGSAVMHFTITPEGRTQGIRVDGTLDDDRVRACIAEEIATWTFHKASGHVQVNYPLTFVLADN